jgi:hypothetical protein
VEADWITTKLVFFRLGLGHAAGVEAIYDVEREVWIYRESVQFLTPTSAPTRRGPSH